MKKNELKQKLAEMFLNERSQFASLTEITVLQIIDNAVEAVCAENEDSYKVTALLTANEHEALTEALTEEDYFGSFDFVNEHDMFKHELTIVKAKTYIGCIICHADFLAEELQQCWQLETENTLSTLLAVKQKLSILVIHEDN